MENKTIEQIKDEILEITLQMESVKQNLSELEKQESNKVEIDFALFMEWADNYFIQKVNLYSIASDLETEIDLDDCCNVELSIEYGNQIEIEKEWKDTEDIVKVVLELAKQDLKNWMVSEFNNHTGKENENNL
jgi:hypothetical protein